MGEKADCRRDETGCEPTHSGSYPNMTSLWSPHHLWSVNLSMTVGQEPSLPQLPRLLFAQGRSARACRVGRGANCLCLFRVEMARRGEIPQICRRPGEPERMAVDISSDAAVIDHALRPGADCLGVPTTSAKAAADSTETPDGNLCRPKLQNTASFHQKEAGFLFLLAFKSLKMTKIPPAAYF